jgi:lipid-binding SYLF domain-containing protein
MRKISLVGVSATVAAAAIVGTAAPAGADITTDVATIGSVAQGPTVDRQGPTIG